jgi:hypothetical protein
MSRSGMSKRKSIHRDIRWSGDDEHGGVTDVLNNIVKGEGVDNTRREEFNSGLKFLTKPLHEGDNKGGLVTRFLEVLELHTEEVEPVLEVNEVISTLHRKVHVLELGTDS